MAELRAVIAGVEGADQPAGDRLRWRGDLLDDETVWTATITAVEVASTDDERVALGDGLIDEQIGSRPVLRERWHRQRESHSDVRAVFTAMWDHLDSLGIDRGWWAVPRS